MTDPLHKLNLTLPGGVTFNAEGTPELVDARFDKFEALVRDIMKSQTETAVAKPANAQNSGNGNGLTTALTQDEITRLFSQDAFYGVALRAMPKGSTADEDSLLAVLYGFATILSDTNVSSVLLMRAAEKSGLQASRLDRVLAKHEQFVTRSGSGKGTRYGLNNPGMLKAVEILKGILG
jgi:hypothetical protein